MSPLHRVARSLLKEGGATPSHGGAGRGGHEGTQILGLDDLMPLGDGSGGGPVDATPTPATRLPEPLPPRLLVPSGERARPRTREEITRVTGFAGDEPTRRSRLAEQAAALRDAALATRRPTPAADDTSPSRQPAFGGETPSWAEETRLSRGMPVVEAPRPSRAMHVAPQPAEAPWPSRSPVALQPADGARPSRSMPAAPSPHADETRISRGMPVADVARPSRSMPAAPSPDVARPSRSLPVAQSPHADETRISRGMPVADVARPSRSMPVAPSPDLARPSRSMPAAQSPHADETRISRGMPVADAARPSRSMPAAPSPDAGRPSRSMPAVPSPSAVPSTSAHADETRVSRAAPRVDDRAGRAEPAGRARFGGDADPVTRISRAVPVAASPPPSAPRPPERLASAPPATRPAASAGERAQAASPSSERAPSPAAPPAPLSLEEQLRRLPILDGIPPPALTAAAAAGDLQLLAHARDDLLDTDGSALIVAAGQVALACFASELLGTERAAQAAARAAAAKDDAAPAKRRAGPSKAARKELKRRGELGPLIGLAERNLAFFEDGDLVDLRFPTTPAEHAYGVYAVTPVTAIALRRPLLEAWKRAWPFFADRVRRASQTARQRIDVVVGARAEVADFFVRHGLSVAQVVRVRQIDKCIECGACEAACEERYGAKRLSLDGRVLGGLDFVDACHTCTDQRCIDPCAFDAIQYDVARKEIVIIEAACTGCTLCATACPYKAIEMHDLAERPLLALRLEREGKLGFGDDAPPIVTAAFGEIAPRKAKLKRMASKCDHCIDYADQACISACPTGALFDALPSDVFAARDGAISAAAQSGYDHTAQVDPAALLDPRKFVDGLGAGGADQLDRARSRKPRILTAWMWVVGLGAWSLFAVEIALRKLHPIASVDYLYQRLIDGIDADIALTRVDYRAGCDLAVRLGVVGSVIMFSGLLYPARRRLAFLRNVGSQRAWFDMHVLTGVVGPLFVLLHTAARLDNWVSLAVWSMIGTVLSGLLGRYLSTQLPERASSAPLEALEVGRRLGELRAAHPSMSAVDDVVARHRAEVASVARRGPLAVLAFLLVDDLARLVGRERRRLALRLRAVGDRRARRAGLRAARDLARFERRRALLPVIEPLFRRWKAVHVPFAVALTLIAAVHIALSL